MYLTNVASGAHTRKWFHGQLVPAAIDLRGGRLMSRLTSAKCGTLTLWFIVGFLGLCTVKPAGAVVSYVAPSLGSCTRTSAGCTQCQITTSRAVAAGHSIILSCSTSSGSPAPSASDAGGAYSLDADAASGGNNTRGSILSRRAIT